MYLAILVFCPYIQRSLAKGLKRILESWIILSIQICFCFLPLKVPLYLIFYLNFLNQLVIPTYMFCFFQLQAIKKRPLSPKIFSCSLHTLYIFLTLVLVMESVEMKRKYYWKIRYEISMERSFYVRYTLCIYSSTCFL